MKRKIEILSRLSASALLLAGCTAIENESPDFPFHTEDDVVRTKVINTSEEIVPNSVLVKINGSSDEALRELEGMKGLLKVERLFKSTPGNEDLEAEFGLDRWYEVTFEENIGAVNMASKLAECKRIDVVEYNKLLKKASDEITYPLKSGDFVETRAAAGTGTIPFNDKYAGDQWNFLNHGNASIAATAYKGGDINVKDVWNTITTGDPSIIVAVIDEGVKHTHPDLQANMWVNEAEKSGTSGVDDDGNGYIDDIHGYNFVSNGPISWTSKGDSGHGTHCAGIIAAVNNNNVGICSVAGGSGKNDGVKMMGLQIFDGDYSNLASTAKAIKYAADMGASVISASYGHGGFKSDAAFKRYGGSTVDALAYFEAHDNSEVLDGNLAIFASGNDGVEEAYYPGALNNMICVSAFGPDYLPTYYTNYGYGCNIVAPGGEAYLPPWTSMKGMILSTLPSELNDGEDYGYMQGSSMACPHVSGVAALGLAYAKKLGKTFTLQEYKDMIVTSANDFDSRLSGTKSYYKNAKPDLELYKFRKKMGAGSIDAWLLMMKIEGVPCLTARTGENQWLDISDYFGTSSANLTYLDVEVSDADRKALGLAEDPYIKYGKLYIHPTEVGAGKIKITAIGGGDVVGGEDAVGGMKVSQEVAIISRSFKSSNGGWL